MQLRSRSRLLPLAAAAATVVVALGAAWVLRAGGAPPAADLPQADVPWAELPAGPALTARSFVGTPRTGVRPCVAADLQAREDGNRDAAGREAFGAWWLVNRSSSECLLTGSVAKVTGVLGTGRRDIVLKAKVSSAHDPRPVVVPPGGRGFVGYTTFPKCYDVSPPPDSSATDVDLELLGGTVRVVSAEPLHLGCGVSEGIRLTDAGGRPDTNLVLPAVADLVPSLAMPGKLTRGAANDYVLTLTNPTDAPIALDPCPSYSIGTAAMKQAFALNCAGQDPIPAGGRLTFAMRVFVPTSAAPGPATLSWVMRLEGVQVHASAEAVIEGELPGCGGPSLLPGEVRPCDPEKSPIP